MVKRSRRYFNFYKVAFTQLSSASSDGSGTVSLIWETEILLKLNTHKHYSNSKFVLNLILQNLRVSIEQAVITGRFDQFGSNLICMSSSCFQFARTFSKFMGKDRPVRSSPRNRTLSLCNESTIF